MSLGRNEGGLVVMLKVLAHKCNTMSHGLTLLFLDESASKKGLGLRVQGLGL